MAKFIKQRDLTSAYTSGSMPSSKPQYLYAILTHKGIHLLVRKCTASGVWFISYEPLRMRNQFAHNLIVRSPLNGKGSSCRLLVYTGTPFFSNSQSNIVIFVPGLSRGNYTESEFTVFIRLYTTHISTCHVLFILLSVPV